MTGTASEVSGSAQFFSGFNRITSYNVCYTKLLRPDAIPLLKPQTSEQEVENQNVECDVKKISCGVVLDPKGLKET